MLQTVGRRVEVEYAGEWADDVRRTRLVAIGTVGDLDPADLTSKFDSCLTMGAG